ncbi:MAG: hypothetical protein QOE70_2675 [Chthoniobacter sp.]|jgi:hypothetical protein|nr:hypothetical protein [Chthoniobacter sp.]
MRSKARVTRLDLQELQAADYWNEELHEWLAECHAGVLLLTPHSIERPWVLKEATILTWRSRLDKRFKLFPALFDGVTSDMLEKGRFAPLVISSLQKVAGKTPEAIAEEIAQIVGPPAERDTPLDELAKTLTDLLVPPHVGGSVAEKLARKLGVDETRWVPGGPPEITRVRWIAGRLVRESLGEYTCVYDLMKDLVSTMSSALIAWQILEIVSPYSVSADAAGRLCEVARWPQKFQ